LNVRFLDGEPEPTAGGIKFPEGKNMKRVRRVKTHKAQKKLPNAMTHGMFTQVTILPGEDPQAFLKLHLNLIQEWQPSGPTEDDAVLTIAKGIWRKGRFQRFLEGKVAVYTTYPGHPGYDEISALRGLSELLDIAPDVLDGPMGPLSEDMKRSLEEEFPEENFKSTLERAQATKKYIDSEVLPKLQREEKPVQISHWESSQIVTPEEFEREIALDERVDATIDRATKRLIQIKAMKQMLAQTAGNRVTGPNEERERSLVRSLQVVGEK
jgi:hypothetical protein